MVAHAKVPAAPKRRPTPSSSKRSRESYDKSRSRTATPAQDPFKKADDRDNTGLPAFLRQSNSEIQARFEDLIWQQNNRIAQGRINKDPSFPWAQYHTKDTKTRNRYADIWPWANSRVHLKVPKGECDYINASPILISSSKDSTETRYIATQGPKELSLHHFWQMIWHETNHVGVIVMLTQLAEGPREKCHQYYPDVTDHDGFSLEWTTETGEECKSTVKAMESTFDEASKTTIRKLLLSYGDESKVIWHLLFLGWPDYGVPENQDRDALLALIKLSKMKNQDSDSPRIIHCSAGVGRSGTFIALEHLLAELEAGTLDEVSDTDDIIHGTVNKLREQRMTMVQSEIQYVLLYELLREQYRKRNTEKASDSALASASASASVQVVTAEALAIEKISPTSGEPSPKVMRLSRSIQRVFLRHSSRSSSRVGRESSSEGKAPMTP
ncbi:hypothetical protein MMC17_005508 [Xylographa soralifera]|nr:hypothetical protein [Xylographa soralifera]